MRGIAAHEFPCRNRGCKRCCRDTAGRGGGFGRKAAAQPAAARFAPSLCPTLPLAGGCGARRLDRSGADHLGRADCDPPHDRFRLHRARPRADRQVFPGDDRRRRGIGAVERAALLPRHHARRAHRRRSAQRRVRAPHLALQRLLRHREKRRTRLAADRGHHADQGRGRVVGFGRAAQSRAVHRREHHDGGDKPATVGLRARGDPAHRAAALRLRPRRAPPLANRARHARRRFGLCGRADRRHSRAAGLHQ